MTETEATLAREVDRDDLIARLRALRPAFESEGVSHMTLFGSRGRGDNRADSDVDLMIEAEDGRKFSFVEMAGVSLIVQDNFGVPASVVMRRSAKRSMLAAATRDGVKVF